MRFTLRYEGPLRGSTGGNTQHKHDIRCYLHPQLQQLWDLEPLSRVRSDWVAGSAEANEWSRGTANRQVAGQSYVVLVQHHLRLIAELDILLLRPESPGSILQRADIDNRLKVLFDALRRPDKPQEVPETWVPSPDQIPLYCLLDDDRLISRVNVETDRLLDAKSPDDVILIVRTTIRASSPTYASMQIVS